MVKTALACAAVAFVATFAACRAQEPPVPSTSASPSSPSELEKLAARFAPTDIIADVSNLSPADRSVLATLVEASKMIDALFLRQAWVGNEEMLLDLARDESSEGRERLNYFLINKGPWSRLDHNQPFVPGAPAKPEGANFYPEGASKAEVERWIQSLPASERARATGFFTVVRRGPTGAFALVPYSMEYQNELVRIAGLLREAAAKASEPTLKTFLAKRADAFLSNDYYDSDVAWMELAGAIEPTIGPYEVYEDEFFNYKAAFESFITVRDEAESAKLQKFGAELQDIENHLPIDPEPSQPGTRPVGAHRGRQRGLRRGRRQPRRPNRGLQPAQRRTRDTGKGRQARDVEERPGREVREDSDADLEGRARVRPIEPTSRLRRSSHTS